MDVLLSRTSLDGPTSVRPFTAYVLSLGGDLSSAQLNTFYSIVDVISYFSPF